MPIAIRDLVIVTIINTLLSNRYLDALDDVVATGDLFASTAQIKLLVRKTRESRIQLAEQYIIKEHERLDRVQRLLEQFKRQVACVSRIEDHEGTTQRDSSLALSRKARSLHASLHPVSSLNFISTWLDIENAIRENTSSKDFLRDVSNLHSHRLRNEDRDEAIDAILRLQQIYGTSTEDMASGRVAGYQSSPMSSGDRFRVALAAELEGNMPSASEWMTLAISNQSSNSTNSLVSLRLARIQSKLGNNAEAVLYAEDAVRHDPKNTTIHMELARYKNQHESSKNKKQPREGVFKQEGKSNRMPGSQWKQTKPGHFPYNSTNYETLCRGDVGKVSDTSGKLKCYIRRGRNPLHVYKEEQLSLEPSVLLVHDVISEKEAEYIKRKAFTQLERATLAMNGSSKMKSKSRIGKVAWLRDSDSSILSKISGRIMEMTGLDTAYDRQAAEHFQVVNYGLGGHYMPHTDYFGDVAGKVPKHISVAGDRLATFLIYLSSVHSGGGTAFTEIPLLVKPKKYSALFWYNLHNSGSPDYRTIHAGCPVLLGNKWVINKWIREKAQMFRRKCTSNYQNPKYFK